MREWTQKKDKTVFSHLVWGDTRRYKGVGRKSPQKLFISKCEKPNNFQRSRKKYNLTNNLIY